MDLICPKCYSSKIKKNGFTHYKKQNYKCKACGRQFVANNTHNIKSTESNLIEKSLKERLALRAICRIFDISLNGLYTFAHMTWSLVPADLGLDSELVEKIRQSSQSIHIQLDEMWSFVKKRKQKQWIWITFDPLTRLVLAVHIGGRGTRAAKRFWRKIPSSIRKVATFETDNWKAYKKIIPSDRHKTGKDLTYFIEGFNATIRARVSRLVRKTLSFSKKQYWHKLAIKWTLWQLNLEKGSLTFASPPI